MADEGLFEFWAEASKTRFMIHPADEPVLKRYEPHYRFPLDTLVGPFMGPARSAPITLLYANGRRSEKDADPTSIEAYLPRYAHHLSGDAPLPWFTKHPPARKWTETRIKPFGMPYDQARERIAFLNIVPYKTWDIADWQKQVVQDLTEELPSVKMMRHWVHNVLIPDAIAERRLVVCLRASKFWKLAATGERVGGLFKPEWNRLGVLPLADRPAVLGFMNERLAIKVGKPTPRDENSIAVPGPSEHGRTRAGISDESPYFTITSHPKGKHSAAFLEFREGRLDGEGARRLMAAKVTHIFHDRHRAHARWRKELFNLYRVEQPVRDFVRAGMNHTFDDLKGYEEVKSERQMLAHACWDISGGFIEIDPKFP